MRVDKTYIEECKRCIERYGSVKLAKDLGVSLGRVCNWRVRGIPEGYRRFITAKFPEFWEVSTSN